MGHSATLYTMVSTYIKNEISHSSCKVKKEKNNIKHIHSEKKIKSLNEIFVGNDGRQTGHLHPKM